MRFVLLLLLLPIGTSALPLGQQPNFNEMLKRIQDNVNYGVDMLQRLFDGFVERIKYGLQSTSDDGQINDNSTESLPAEGSEKEDSFPEKVMNVLKTGYEVILKDDEGIPILDMEHMRAYEKKAIERIYKENLEKDWKKTRISHNSKSFNSAA